jgi:hypothetical protein
MQISEYEFPIVIDSQNNVRCRNNIIHFSIKEALKKIVEYAEILEKQSIIGRVK